MLPLFIGVNFEFLHCNLMPHDICFLLFCGWGELLSIFMNVQSLSFLLSVKVHTSELKKYKQSLKTIKHCKMSEVKSILIGELWFLYFGKPKKSILRVNLFHCI